MFGLALVMGLFGLLVLAILWPVPRSGRKLLVRWGVPDPNDEEIATAVRYLKRRRFWYPWLYFGLSYGVDSLRMNAPDSGWLSPLLLVLLSGALIAEVFAQRRTRAPRRVAALRPRELSDVVPLWALVSHAVAVVAAVVVCGGAVAGLPWAARWLLTADFRGIALGVCVGSALAVWLIVWLALRRPADGAPRVDAALRMRSANVAVGLGIGMLGALLSGPAGIMSWLVLVAALVAWVAVVSPLRPGVARTQTG